MQTGPQAIEEIVGYVMPPFYDHSIQSKPSGKVSNFKNFLQSCFKLLKDEKALKELCNIIDQYD